MKKDILKKTDFLHYYANYGDEFIIHAKIYCLRTEMDSTGKIT